MENTNNNSMNHGLTAAKTAKRDEFYTQYADIEKEIEAYLEFDPNTFRDKVVYCNCDDPYESNFFKYFAANFNRLGLRKLITTSYDGSLIAGRQLAFNEYTTGNNKRKKPKSICVQIEEVTDLDGDGSVGIEDVRLFLEHNAHSRTPLDGGGDFRSDECVNLLREADIVVTNPPFSLFREYVSLLMENSKKFLVVGPKNAITYREIFRLIKNNELWLGAGFSNGNAYFSIPPQESREFATGVFDPNTGLVKFRNVGWFTNLDHGRRYKKIPLMTEEENLRFSKHKDIKGKEEYERYDNYDAIEVPYVDAIPSDYKGAMGVPITFLDRFNPDQFEILGWARGCEEYGAYPTKRYKNPKQHKPNGSVANGGKVNTGPNILHKTKPKKTYYTADNADGYIEQLYMRIIICHKQVSDLKG